MPSGWQFYDFLDGRGQNVIRAWLDAQQANVKVALNTRLNDLEQLDHRDWFGPMFEEFKGKEDGLVAVRVKKLRTPYRLIGYYGPGANMVTLLIGVTEKDGKYVPRTYATQAFNRTFEVALDPEGRRIRHDFR